MAIYLPTVFSVNNPPQKTDPNFYAVAEHIAIFMDEDQDDFHKFGMHLLPESKGDRVITIKTKKITNTERCKELFNEWIKCTANPKWEQVIEALKKSGLEGPANNLTAALNNSEQPHAQGKSKSMKNW